METKPGYRSTEFWLSMVALAVLIAAEPLGMHITGDLHAILIGFIPAQYTAGRTLTKRAASKPAETTV